MLCMATSKSIGIVSGDKFKSRPLHNDATEVHILKKLIQICQTEE